MQYSDHYNLNLPEGTDIVNPLVQDNPNYIAIDAALYANKLRVIGGASEVKTGTNHAITRSDSDIDNIKFTATSNWVSGDTMTIDGVSVSVFLPDGSAPLDGSYVINSEVLVLLNGTRATLYTFVQVDPADVTALDNRVTTLETDSIIREETSITTAASGAFSFNIDAGHKLVNAYAKGVAGYITFFGATDTAYNGRLFDYNTDQHLGSTTFTLVTEKYVPLS